MRSKRARLSKALMCYNGSMLSFRAYRVLILIGVAVWQLWLPVLAYAHLSKTGAMNIEVCTSLGMKTLVIAKSAEHNFENNFQQSAEPSLAQKTSIIPSESGTPPQSASPDDHPCCVFNLSSPPHSGSPSAGLGDKPTGEVLELVTTILSSDFLNLHSPPTGPPSLL